jgi:hypothetical protein
MKIRMTGLPAEIDQAIKALRDIPDLDVIQADSPYPNRGDSRMVRMYIEARLSGRDGDVP